MTRALGALVLVVVGATSVVADDWPAAVVTEVFSQDRGWFVRVVPGASLGDAVGFAGARKGRHATAEFYRRRPDRSYALATVITLGNPIAPVRFFVTNRGFLVTLDNWHNLGYGQVLASYGPDGKRRAAYALADLFTPDEIAAFSHSVSSIRWRIDPAYVRDGQQSIHVGIGNGEGREIIFEPETGAWQQCEARAGRHQCRDTNDVRVWRAYREPQLRR
jgi:hypothetical protein